MPTISRAELKKLRDIQKALEVVKPGVIRNHYVYGEDRITFRFGIGGAKGGQKQMDALRKAFDLVPGLYLGLFKDDGEHFAGGNGMILCFKDPETGQPVMTPSLRDKLVSGHLAGIETMLKTVELYKQMEFDENGNWLNPDRYKTDDFLMPVLENGRKPTSEGCS